MAPPAPPIALSLSALEAVFVPLLAAVHRHVRRLGTADYLAVAALLRSLFAGRDTVPARELRASLASLLANDQEQWRQIAALLDQRLGLRLAPTAGKVGVAKAPRAAGRAGVVVPDRPVGRRYTSRAALAAVGALCLALVAVRGDRIVDPPPPPPPEQPPVEKTIKEVKECIQEPISAAWNLEPIKAKPEDTAPKTIEGLRPVAPRDYLFFALAGLLAAAALRLLGLPRASWRAAFLARRREAAEREDRRVEHRRLLRDLNAKGLSEGIEYIVPRHPAVARAAIEACATLLGRMKSDLVGRDLDVPATIDATIEAGGRGVAVLRPSLAPQALLVLVDRGHGDHPWLGGFERVLAELGRQGVRLVRYDFLRGNPNRVFPPNDTAAKLDFAALARRHAGMPLLLYSHAPEVARFDGRPATWLSFMDAFSLRAWIDPDPSGDEDRRAACAALERARFARFDLDDDHLVALGRYVAARAVGVRVPPRRPLPVPVPAPASVPVPIAVPVPVAAPVAVPVPVVPEVGAIERALHTWASLCALVPDANWDQVEAVRRRFPEVHEQLGERRDVSLLIDWVCDQPRQHHRDREQHQRCLKIDAELEDVLRAELLEKSPELAMAGHRFILDQLGEAAPQNEYQRHRWALYRARHAMILEPKQVRSIIESVGNGPLAEELARILKSAIAVAGGRVWDEQTVALARATSEKLDPDRAAEGAHPSGAWLGPPLRQLLRGHRTLSAIALGIAIALAGSGALALRFAAERDPLRRLLIVERPAPPQAARLDTRELYRLVKGSAGPSVPGMVRIPGGTFQMGSPPKEKDRDKDETQHWVTVRGFYLAPAEVTQAEYRRVTGKSPSSDKTCGDSCPVETVTWLDAATYCNALSQQEKLEPCYLIDGDKVEWPDPEGCKGYRLPTEAEWEWAARGGCAGMEERYVGTDEETKVCEQDNVADESSGLPNKFPCNDKQPRLSAVRQFKPNRFQLFDMGGNVLEWVWDWYQPDYEKLTSANPTGPTTGQDRVYRGGSWDSYPGNARVAGRIRSAPSNRDDDLGFRVARSLP